MNKDFERNRKEYIHRNSDKKETVLNELFSKIVGPAIPLPSICLSNKSNIFLQACKIKTEPLKLVYSSGFAESRQMELAFALPDEWKLRQFLSETYYLEETFPMDIMRELIKKAERKNTEFKIEEGLYIDKTKSPWNKLRWNKDIRGLILVQPDWSEKILIFVPILQTETIGKKDLPEWIRRQKSKPWIEFAIPLNDLIKWQQLLNDSLDSHQLKGVQQAVENGASVNYGYIAKHISFGYYIQETLLENALGSRENESIISYFIEQGATVPVDALARMTGWGNKEIYELLIANGADINAESVHMTALERAAAFKDTENVKILLALGARRRKK